MQHIKYSTRSVDQGNRTQQETRDTRQETGLGQGDKSNCNGNLIHNTVKYSLYDLFIFATNLHPLESGIRKQALDFFTIVLPFVRHLSSASSDFH